MMELFSDSQRQFHQIFTQTYGVLYERNARLFKEYFYQLKRYFIYGKVSVHEATGTFFSSLYQKMFQVKKPDDFKSVESSSLSLHSNTI